MSLFKSAAAPARGGGGGGGGDRVAAVAASPALGRDLLAVLTPADAFEFGSRVWGKGFGV